ncbi:hypothetical protein [Chroococcidiopsis sp. SAG 2025]|nr:hypothetical protein [Chroococcidiopsis sp. SAG 2025]
MSINREQGAGSREQGAGSREQLSVTNQLRLTIYDLRLLTSYHSS